MQHELQAFRQEMADPAAGAEARVRQRLEARIRAEASVREPVRPRPRAGVPALATGMLVVALALAGAVAWPEREAGWHAAEGVGAKAPRLGRHLSERNVPGARPGRADADGLLLALPSLDGRDAGVRPTHDRGGWSECALDGCYTES